jgi:serine/threonine-protein kinase
MNTDRNLLFGVLALQADVITPAQFIEACTLWSSRKDAPLADLLAERGWLKTEDKVHVDYLLERKVRKHAGDLGASLAASTPSEVKAALASLGDADIQHTLDGFGPTPEGSPLQTTAYDPEGRGRYQLLHLHAKGGIGKAWLARDVDLGREVALKELLPERASHPAVLARFLEEARITGQLEHPGIVPVYELTRHAESRHPFYTMRFLRGRTLTDAIRVYHQRRSDKQASPLELRELLRMLVAICNAVAFAHARGVLHRDLKPQNVILGDFGEVMILDWGLAKVIGAADDSSKLPVDIGDSERDETIQGQILGTPAYMPPEQAEGRLDRIDERSDVYGLGAILYEILTGQAPFPGKDTKSVLTQVIHEAPALPRRLVTTMPSALQAVCIKALAKQQEQRYGSAKALAQEIDHWLADEPVLAFSDPWVVKTRRWLGRHRPLATGAAAAVVVATLSLGTATVVLTAANDRERQARAAEQQAAERERDARGRAEANLQLARKAVDEGFTRVSEIPELKGQALESLRRDLLKEAKDFYEQFARQQADKPDLQAERGQAYLRLAQITEDFGNRMEAVALARQAQEVFEALSKGYPNRAAYQEGLAQAMLTLGRNYRELQELKPAQEALERAVLAWRQLLAADPRARDYRFRLALTDNELGLLLVRGLKKLTEGVAAWQEAQDLCKQLSAEFPDKPEYLSELAQTFTNAMFQGNYPGHLQQALAEGERAVPLLEQLVHKYPGVADYQWRLAYCLSNIGQGFVMARQPQRALTACAKALPVAEQLVRAHPDIPFYRNRVAFIRNSRAVAFAIDGDFRQEVAELKAAEGEASEGMTIYNSACAYCMAAAAARKDAGLSRVEKDNLEGQYLDSAMTMLRKARDTKRHFKSAESVSLLDSDDDLQALREGRRREEFAKFVAQVKENARGQK